MRPRLFSLTLRIVIIVAGCFHGQVKAQPGSADSLRNLQLFQAIRAGNTEKMETLLKGGLSANANLNGYSALMAAALSGTSEAMKVLIAHGADVNYFNRDSISAIWLAVPDLDKTTLLVKNGANVQQCSREGNTVLIKLVTIPGSSAVLQLLITAGCDPLKSGLANDIMYNAASSGDTAIIRLLMAHGVSVKDTSSFGDYPINQAVNYRSFDVVKMLVDNGAGVNVSPAHAFLPLFVGVTPLMWAAVSNDKPTFYYLLAHGADAKVKSPGGYTALMFLAMSETDDPKMTQALIEHGAVASEKALDETDALSHFKLRGNTPSVELLTKKDGKK